MKLWIGLACSMLLFTASAFIPKHDEQSFEKFGLNSTGSVQSADCYCGPHSTSCSTGFFGTYCSCKPGFAQTAKTCKECQCQDRLQTCSFFLGAKICICAKGYAFDGTRCKICNCGAKETLCLYTGDNRQKTCYCQSGYQPKDDVCKECNCGDKGSCSFENGQKVCKCDDGFAEEFGKCNDCNCGNYSSCTFPKVGAKICHCLPGYAKTGDVCKAECNSTLMCVNHGVCGKDGFGSFCKCKEGTEGDYCETVTECKNKPDKCGKGDIAECVHDVVGGRGTCKCKVEGVSYDTSTTSCRKECDLVHMCTNDATCAQKDYGNFCECKKGTEGDHCETVTECKNNPNMCGTLNTTNCIYNATSGRGTCKCIDEALTYDSTSQSCRDCSCGNHGSCRFYEGRKICECEKGYSEKLSECYECSCGNKSERCYFNTTASKICVCHPGYAQKQGTCIAECNSTRKCANEGTCVKGDFGSFCECKEGTEGAYCETVTECKYNPDKCGPRDIADCVYDSASRRGTCKCKIEGFSYDALVGSCRRECDLVYRCAHDSTCAQTDFGNFCNCKKGTEGDYCETVTECKNNPNMCGTTGSVVCVYDAVSGGGMCHCRDETLIYDSATKSCRKCDCGEHGSCLFQGGQKVCKCEDGYSEKLGECYGCTCANEWEICYFNGTGSKICACSSGYARKEGLCITECSSSRNCANQGVCVKEDFGSFCDCRSGTEGDLCEIVTACKNNPHMCGKRAAAMCAYDASSARGTCKCRHEGFVYDASKDSCRKECNLNSKCGNEGTCVKTDFGYCCACNPGTDGDLCEKVTECEDRPTMCGTTGVAKCVYQCGRATCKCKDGKLGYDDIQQSCRECNCGDFGCCRFLDGQKVCSCKKGYSEKFGKCYDCNCGDQEKSCFFRSNGSKVCDCSEGHAQKGETCAECTCGNETEHCYFDRNRNAICTCRTGYALKEGICTAKCDAKNVCANHGKCVKRTFGSFCECEEGTEGAHCETVTECKNNPDMCGTTGIAECVYDTIRGAGTCKCQIDGLVYDASKDSCRRGCNLTHKCANEGTCEHRDFGHFCDCKNGTEGDRCETVTECKENSDMCGATDTVECVYDTATGGGTCRCKVEGFMYDVRTDLCRRECDRENKCENEGDCTTGNFGHFCDCKNGTEGDYCEIVTDCKLDPNMCGTNVADCVFNATNGQGSCKCKVEDLKYDSTQKSCRKECGDENGCENQAECVTGKFGNFCDCKNGTESDYCGIVTDCKYDPDMCGTSDSAMCVYDTKKEQGTCQCNVEGLKYDSTVKSCRKECGDGNRCENQAECTTGKFGNFCDCKNGTESDYCGIVTDCKNDPYMCGTSDSVMCVYDTKKEQGICQCNVEGLTYDSTVKACRRTCNDGDDCAHGGICKDFGSSSFCKCQDGTNGDRCEIIEDCENGGRFENCKGKRGTCEYDSSTLKPICRCERNEKFNSITNTCEECDCGWRSTSCDIRYGRKLCQCEVGYKQRFDICEECDCGKGALNCTFVEGQKQCSCSEGSIEENGRCKNSCMRTRCRGGTCRMVGDREECICPQGQQLVDGTCSTGHCRQDRCYGGRCMKIEGILTCVCPKGFHLEGIGCYETQCKQNNCFGGKCRVVEGEEICTCRDGYILENDVCIKIM